MSFDEKTNILDLGNLPNLAKDAEERTQACLLVLAGSQAGRLYRLERSVMTIGRGQQATIRIEDEGVSRLHATFSQDAEGVLLCDLGSTNGTLCNGEAITEYRLLDGDKIQVGAATILKFSYQDSVEEEFQRRQYESVTKDALTGCFNRKYLMERFPNEAAFGARHNTAIAMAVLDIDHFKNINDSFGHQAGDAVLRDLGALLRETMRLDDIVARYGGEEFALLMRGLDAKHAMLAAERIRLAIAEHVFSYHGKTMSVTASLGVAVWLPESREPAEYKQLFSCADKALFRAKDAGRNCSKIGDYHNPG